MSTAVPSVRPKKRTTKPSVQMQPRAIDAFLLRALCDGLSYVQAAKSLDGLGQVTERGHRWSAASVHWRLKLLIDKHEKGPVKEWTKPRVNNKLVCIRDHEQSANDLRRQLRAMTAMYHAERKDHESVRRQLAQTKLELERLRAGMVA